MNGKSSNRPLMPAGNTDIENNKGTLNEAEENYRF
jgi:hypothetical protein